MTGPLELDLDALSAMREAEAARGYQVGTLAEISTAISLKRIADVLCPDPDGLRPSILLALHDIEMTLRGTGS